MRTLKQSTEHRLCPQCGLPACERFGWTACLSWNTQKKAVCGWKRVAGALQLKGFRCCPSCAGTLKRFLRQFGIIGSVSCAQTYAAAKRAHSEHVCARAVRASGGTGVEVGNASGKCESGARVGSVTRLESTRGRPTSTECPGRRRPFKTTFYRLAGPRPNARVVHVDKRVIASPLTLEARGNVLALILMTTFTGAGLVRAH